ncbi:unnamed protein product [marine sediment metagenome]|uniref:Uncharacterized protein n=1 Tax=marine sediment metagenome TaxID=412755 RepID=X0SPU9_9ZZZZ
MELTLLQETSITLTELDNMDEERKWIYYYYILHTKKMENERLDELNNKNKPPTHSLSFPDEFVSKIRREQNVVV